MMKHLLLGGVLFGLAGSSIWAQQPGRPTHDLSGAPIQKHLPGNQPTFHANAVGSGANNDSPPAGAILDLTGTPIPGGGNYTYKMYTVDFSATQANTAITFAFREDPAFIYFSNPSVIDLAGGGNLFVNGNFSGAVYTSNGNNATPVGWIYANVYGATYGGVLTPNCGVGTGGAFGTGNCWYDGAVQAYDALTQTIATTIGHHYRISFWIADDSGCAINGGPPCNFSELSTNGDTTDTGGNGINVTVYKGAALPAPAAINFELRREMVTPNQGMTALASARDVNNNLVNMQDAATKVGFNHFNWVQMIVNNLLLKVCLASYTPDCADHTVRGGAVAPLPTPDPPYGGWAYEYWDTYCPGSSCPFLSPVQDYWSMYWDEYFSDGPPYVASPTTPEYKKYYQPGNTFASIGTTVSPSTALGFYYGDMPTTNYIVPSTTSYQNDSFVTMLVGVTGSCNLLVSSNCGFQIFPGTIFKWNSTNGSITFASTPGDVPSFVATPAHEATSFLAASSSPSVHRDGKNPVKVPVNPVSLSGQELADSLISVDQLYSLTGLTPESLAAMGGGISIFSGSLVPNQAAALAAVQAGGTLVLPSQISTIASGLAYSRVTQTFNGTVTVTNISGSAINGPLQILFTDLPDSVTMVNATGNFSGVPYLTMATATLAPGQSITAKVQFKNPANATITLTPGIYSGSIQ